MDEQTGESSRLIDLPNGGFSIIMGNLLMQGNNAQNNNLVGYGLEGLTNTLGEIYFVNNTLINKRTASCIFVSLAAATTVANVTNNIFTGTGTLINGTTTTMSNNIIDPVITNLNFLNEANYDYHLTSSSPAVNSGIIVSSISGYSLTPDSTYEHPTSFGLRTSSSTIDVGAYEYTPSTSILEVPTNKLTAYPNPFTNRIILKNTTLSKSEIGLFNLLGQDFSSLISVRLEGNNTIIYTSNLSKGIYTIQTKNSSNIICKE
jgi:hypothetical protein